MAFFFLADPEYARRPARVKPRAGAAFHPCEDERNFAKVSGNANVTLLKPAVMSAIRIDRCSATNVPGPAAAPRGPLGPTAAGMGPDSAPCMGVIAIHYIASGGVCTVCTTPRAIRRWWGWGSSLTCSDSDTPSTPDHIAAMDDTVRYMLRTGDRRPLGVGFFFALGHSTQVVAALALRHNFCSSRVAHARDNPQLQSLGGVIGAGVSGVFLWVIGILNLAGAAGAPGRSGNRRAPVCTATLTWRSCWRGGACSAASLAGACGGPFLDAQLADVSAGLCCSVWDSTRPRRSVCVSQHRPAPPPATCRFPRSSQALPILFAAGRRRFHGHDRRHPDVRKPTTGRQGTRCERFSTT